ncbi:MAG TPA: hypothetical protein VMS56_10895 [Thermoanaerobaculia bacterium]|nr:hypothetical protein [Thermoanaerobaculia bacterium]
MGSDRSAGNGPARGRGALSLLLLASALVLLSLRLFALVDRHAVDLPAADQWDLYAAFMEPHDAWELFRWQHPPVRQGVGMWVLDAANRLTRWNARAHSFAIAGILVLCCLAACVLKWKLFGRLHASDFAIPLIVLTTAQYQTLVVVPNPAHSALPLLLVLLTVLALVSLREPWRTAAIALLLFAAVHTGFGQLLPPVVAGVLALHLRRAPEPGRRAIRAGAAAGIAAALVSIGVFLAGFDFFSSADCFEWISGDVFMIPAFVCIAFARFVGVGFQRFGLLASAAGLLVAAAAFALFARSLRDEWKGAPDDRVRDANLILLGFSLLFVTAAAWGRVCLSPMTGESSRYMTLLIPAFLALYFASLQSSRRIWTAILIAGVVLGSLPVGIGSGHPAADRSDRARRWRACYLATRDIETCNARTLYSVHPNPQQTRLREKLDYLERNRLSLFAD